MSPSVPAPSTPALADLTNARPSPSAPAVATPRKPSLSASISPPDTPVTPNSPPYVTATSTPATAPTRKTKGLADIAAEHHHTVNIALATNHPHLDLDDAHQEQPLQQHSGNEEAQPNDPAHKEQHPTDSLKAEKYDDQPSVAPCGEDHLKPSKDVMKLFDSIITSPPATEDPSAPPEDLLNAHVLDSSRPDPEALHTDPITDTTFNATPETSQLAAAQSHPELPIFEPEQQPTSDVQPVHLESVPFKDQSPQPLTDIYPPQELSESSSQNSPPSPPPTNLALSANVWTSRTRPRSPKLRLAAAAAMRASMAPASTITPPPKSKKITAQSNQGRHFEATRPVSPNFQLAAAAAVRTAMKPIEEPHENARKVQPQWGSTKTVPKSPKLRSTGKALSVEAAARRAALLAEEECNETAMRLRAERLRKSRAAWAKKRTAPKSPAVLRRPSTRTTEVQQRKRFIPTPMPDFGQAPPVKQTRASVARLQRKNSVQRSMPPKIPQQRPAKPLGRTVPCPFPLQGVSKHEENLETMQRRQQMDEAEARRSRIFEPVPLREEILDGPTFVPVHHDSSRTEPVSLIPDAEDRSRHTLAYLAAQRDRMEEMEKRKAEAAIEREEREREDAERQWQQIRFKPRPVPKSHYNPDVLPIGSFSGSRSGDSERELRSPTSQMADTEQATPPQETDGGRPRRPSIFEGLRKSLSPLLGVSDSTDLENF